MNRSVLQKSLLLLHWKDVKQCYFPKLFPCHGNRQIHLTSRVGREPKVEEPVASSTTHFGFETVAEGDKSRKVHKVFEDVAQSYDLMNDAMSLGIHRIWKDVFVEKLGPTPGIKLLDMAGGTGDIAFRVLRYLQRAESEESVLKSKSKSVITIADINQNMLDVGKSRAEAETTNQKSSNIELQWNCVDAESLPYQNDCFSAYTIAFGIRNCTHIDQVLKEAYRVLKPGGRFMCLEFGKLEYEALQWLYDQYSFQIIPPMGKILAGQWKPYQYLVESIRKFPTQDNFKAMIGDAGFSLVRYENLTFGVVSIHSGFKL